MYTTNSANNLLDRALATHNAQTGGTLSRREVFDYVEADTFNSIVTGSRENPAYALFDWAEWNASLEYNRNIIGEDGFIEHYEGDSVASPPTNYDFLMKQDTLYDDYRYKGWKK